MSDLVLTNNSSNLYSMNTYYNNYLENRIEQEQRINDLISECTILNESGIGLSEKTKRVAAIYEAKLGDKVKNKFQSFVEFIKNLWNKFMANINKVLKDEKGYLDKYRDIILKRKGKSDIKVSYHGDYSIGIKRITTVTVPDFNWNSMSEALKDDDNYRAKFFAQFKSSMNMSQFNLDDTDFATQVKEFFIGGEAGQQEKTMEEMNLPDMFNFCYNFTKIEEVTKKDIAAMEKAANAVGKAINDNIDKVAAQTNESALLEADGDNTNAGGNNDNAGGDNKGGNAGTTGMTVTDVSKAAGSVDRKDQQDIDNNAQDQAKNAENINGEDASQKKNLVDKVVGRYIEIARTIITAKWTATEQIAKDYMKIIHMHVKSYVGTEEKAGEKQTQNATKYTPDKENNQKGVNTQEKKNQQQQ